jgi:hypothetical protein
MLGLGLLVVAIIVIAGWLMPISMRTAVATQPYWAQVIEMIVLSDIGFYFAHRAFHAFPWLWKFHSIHHSIEELDWLAAARVHPEDQIVTKGCALLPVFALGFSDVAIGVYMLIYGWQSVLIHSNVRLNFGPLRWPLASPEFHHWHHSNDREARNKNFAGQVPVLDYLFGTLHLPPGRKPTKYGLDQPIPQTWRSCFIRSAGLPRRGLSGARDAYPPNPQLNGAATLACSLRFFEEAAGTSRLWGSKELCRRPSGRRRDVLGPPALPRTSPWRSREKCSTPMKSTNYILTLNGFLAR